MILNTLKKAALSVLLVILLFMLAITAAAHPGSTDEDGGHVDRSTGEYHYHHGYPAHNHYDVDDDGQIDCPYDFEDEKSNEDDDGRKEERGIDMSFFDVIGIMVLIFVAAALLNYYGRYLEDQKIDNFLSKCISVLSIICLILSFPVMFVFYPIHTLYSNRAVRIDHQKTVDTYWGMLDRKQNSIDELEKENNFLKEENQKYRSTRMSIYNKGYDKGYDRGIRDGYSTGYRDGSEGFGFDPDYKDDNNDGSNLDT